MRERTARLVLPFVAALVVVATALALRFVKDYRPALLSPAIAPALPATVDIRLEDVTVRGRDRGRDVWSVHAARIDAARGRTRLELAGGIVARLLNGAKTPTTLTAPTAVYDRTGKLLTVSGGILVTIPPGNANPTGGTLTIETPQALWAIGTKTLSCPGTVTGRFARGVLLGDDLKVNLETGDKSLRNFRGRYLLKETDL
jgi:hypothetical protein